jgi:hypothetical protein
MLSCFAKHLVIQFQFQPAETGLPLAQAALDSLPASFMRCRYSLIEILPANKRLYSWLSAVCDFSFAVLVCLFCVFIIICFFFGLKILQARSGCAGTSGQAINAFGVTFFSLLPVLLIRCCPILVVIPFGHTINPPGGCTLLKPVMCCMLFFRFIML